MIRILEINTFATKPFDLRVIHGDHVSLLNEDLEMISNSSHRGFYHTATTSGMLSTGAQYYAIVDNEYLDMWIRTSGMETGGRDQHNKLLKAI